MKKRTKKTLACLLVLVLVFESLTGIPVLAAEEAESGGRQFCYGGRNAAGSGIRRYNGSGRKCIL